MTRGKECMLSFIIGWAITAPVALICGISIGEDLQASKPQHHAIGQDTYIDQSTNSVLFRLHCGCEKTYLAESRLTTTHLCDDHKRLEFEQSKHITTVQAIYEYQLRKDTDETD